MIVFVPASLSCAHAQGVCIINRRLRTSPWKTQKSREVLSFYNLRHDMMHHHLLRASPMRPVNWSNIMFVVTAECRCWRILVGGSSAAGQVAEWPNMPATSNGCQINRVRQKKHLDSPLTMLAGRGRGSPGTSDKALSGRTYQKRQLAGCRTEKRQQTHRWKRIMRPALAIWLSSAAQKATASLPRPPLRVAASRNALSTFGEVTGGSI